MLRFFTSVFVGRPANILLVMIVFLTGYFVLRFTSMGTGRYPRALLLAALGWGAYAAWEGLVLMRSPEANIRVDLLVIWPLLAIVSGWALYRALR